MRKQIPISQVRMGMFIESLVGAWVDHPFWRKSFKLVDPEDLKKLRASPIKEVVIDTRKGLDVLADPTPSEPSQTEEAKEELSPPVAEAPAMMVKTKRIALSEERAQAKKVISESRKAVESMFNDVRMGKAVNAEAAMPLVEDIANSVYRNESALISLVRLKTQDDYTYMHSVAVCALMVALGKELALSEQEIRQAGLAGLLHDLGKAATPLEVLNKPGALTNEEFDIVKKHPEQGYEMLIQSGVTDTVTLDVCLHHHEKIDGSGYPKKLTDNDISIFAKMGAVCDVYDAVTSNRPYKKGWEPGVSLQRMAQWTNHFDQRVFKAFVKSVGIYPVGSMVKLKSGRLAVVIDQGDKSLLKPLVKVFFSTKSKLRIPIEIIDLSKPSAMDQIVGHEDPSVWGIDDVNDLWSQS